MKRILNLLVLSPFFVFAQVPKDIKSISEKNVSQIIKTLSADDMMGRPASDPTKIEKATAFIEGEFKSIGLKKLNGLTTYRQEFNKDKIRLNNISITINGAQVPSEQIIVYSEKTSINYSSGLPIKKTEYDSTVKNTRQFFGKIGFSTRDTTSAIFIIPVEYKNYFNQMRDFFSNRFLSGKKGSQFFILGNYSPESYSIQVSQKLETLTLSNVVGILPGKAKPDEFVIFSAHYDHIGILQPIEGDSIANGADDDASGTTAVIELARYFKKTKNNNRTLVFVAFTAEEIGGYGSRYFSEQMNPDKVVAMFNIEMIGKESKFGKNAAFITGYERSDFGDILQKNVKGTQFNFHPDPYPEQNLFYRSDNATLARQGVPAHSISTDQIDSDKLYHSVNDEFESMDIDNIVKTIQSIAIGSRTIISGDDTPKRIDKATVR